ncbi:LppA family lipoprotein [Amycolatopsis nivea]
MPLRPRSATCLTALALALALTGGCGRQAPEGYAQLMKLPDIDQAKAAYTAMATAIRDRLTAEFGRTWKQEAPLSSTACGKGYLDVGSDGVKLSLPSWDSPGNLPDADWPRAQALVGQIAAGYGFDPTPEVSTNQPGNHTVVYSNPDGALLPFATVKNTGFGVKTGCHLTAEAHRRGGPKPD